jgi:hypothetical protein
MLWDLARLIFATSVIAFAAFGAGHWIEKLLPDNFCGLDRLACRCVGGFGLLSASLFLIGQIAFTPSTITVTLALGVLAAAVAGPFLRGRKASAGLRPSFNVRLIPGVFIAFVLLLTVVAGLADINGDWGNDGVAYHLLGPKVWLRDGVIRPVLDNSHTSFPATAEVMYAAFMLLGGAHGPGFSAVLTLSMFLLATAALSIRAGLDAGGASWAAAFVATMPAVYAGAHSGFVDVLYASFVLAAARIGFDAERSKHFLAFGLFCGFAIATKYTGLLVLPALLLTAGIAVAKSGSLRARTLIAALGIALAAALLVGAPAYVRNWILLGCPIYPPPPLLLSIFHVKYLSPDAVRDFYAYLYQRGGGLGRGLGAFLLLPFRLTYHTANFHGAGGIGLYALALGPFGLMASRRNRFSRALALLALLLTAEWFVTQQESRFLIHVYVIGAIFSVFGWQCVKSVSPRYGSVLCTVAIGCSLAYGLFMIATARAGDVAAVLSSSFAERQRQQRIPFLESFRYLNSERSAQKVLILDRSVPPFYCDKSYLKITGQWNEQPLPGIRNAQDALAHLGELRVSHMLDVRSEVSGFQVPANTPGLTMVFERPNQRIYLVER